MATFMGQQMSGRYSEEVDALRQFFTERLPELGSFTMSQSDYSAGVDKLGFPRDALIEIASAEWLASRNYELSYNQMCQAFFGAANDLKLIIVEGGK